MARPARVVTTTINMDALKDLLLADDEFIRRVFQKGRDLDLLAPTVPAKSALELTGPPIIGKEAFEWIHTYIPHLKMGEASTITRTGVDPRILLNMGLDELDKLWGIGPHIAKRILAARPHLTEEALNKLVYRGVIAERIIHPREVTLSPRLRDYLVGFYHDMTGPGGIPGQRLVQNNILPSWLASLGGREELVTMGFSDFVIGQLLFTRRYPTEEELREIHED